MTRREFLVSSAITAAITGATVRRLLGDEPRYRIGYTTNTRGGWELDPFTGFREAREVGFRYVEAFATALSDYCPHDAAGLPKKIDEIGVRFVAITGGARGGDTAFEDPAKRAAVIANHLEVVRFSQKFGADHQKRTGRFRRHQGNEELGGFGRRKRVRCARVPQKTNLGRRRPGGTTQEDLKNIAETLNILGKRIFGEEGIAWSSSISKTPGRKTRAARNTCPDRRWTR